MLPVTTLQAAVFITVLMSEAGGKSFGLAFLVSRADAPPGERDAARRHRGNAGDRLKKLHGNVLCRFLFKVLPGKEALPIILPQTA